MLTTKSKINNLTLVGDVNEFTAYYYCGWIHFWGPIPSQYYGYNGEKNYDIFIITCNVENQGSALLMFGPKMAKVTASWSYYNITNGQ